MVKHWAQPLILIPINISRSNYNITNLHSKTLQTCAFTGVVACVFTNSTPVTDKAAVAGDIIVTSVWKRTAVADNTAILGKFILTFVRERTTVADNAAVFADIILTYTSARIFTFIRYAFGFGREMHSHEHS